MAMQVNMGASLMCTMGVAPSTLVVLIPNAIHSSYSSSMGSTTVMITNLPA
jgi:hypothetical protein